MLAAAIALFLVGGCSPSVDSVEDRFASEPVSEEAIRRLAAAEARRTSSDGQPAIQILSVDAPRSDAGTAVVSVNLEAVADSWDLASRSGEFGALLVPALFRNPNVAAVEIHFGSGGSNVVTYRFDRRTADNVYWGPTQNRFTEDDITAWHSFYTQATSYEWHEAVVWEDVTSGGFPDSISKLRMPQRRPADQ